MLKFIYATLFAMCLIGNASAGSWNEGSVIGIPTDNAKYPAQIIVGDTGTQWPLISIPPNQWVTIDLSNGPQWGSGPTWQPNIPQDVVGVFLSGLLIISHPNTGFTCNLWANFRAPGSSLQGNAYQVQAVEATAGAGVRSNAAVWVPVVNRKFEIYWYHTPGCPSMLNLSVQAYVR